MTAGLSRVPRRIEFCVPNFFFIKAGQLRIESDRNVGRTYLLDRRGRIVAVLKEGNDDGRKR